jgi:hypothetical protein
VTYTLDTNILVYMQQRYPRELFPSVWDAVEALAGGGDACICEEIHEETKRGDDGLFEWAQSLSGFVCELTDTELALAGEISTRFPDWVREQKNAGDPFLIAHAREAQCDIVSDERRAGPGVADHNQKVPNVAEMYGVRCIAFLDLARELNWRF